MDTICIPKYLTHTKSIQLHKICKLLKISNYKKKIKSYLINKINIKILFLLNNHNLHDICIQSNIPLKKNISRNSLIYKINNFFKKKRKYNYISIYYNYIIANNVNNKIYNETFGITCEYSLCNIYNLKNNLFYRTNNLYINELSPIMKNIQNELTNKYKLKCIEYTGYKNNCSDFICQDNITLHKYTLSIKSNTSTQLLVCPQTIGQCTKKTFIDYIHKFTKYNDIKLNSYHDIKQFICNNLQFLFNKYYENLFCCDYLLWICRSNKYNTAENIQYQLIKKPDLIKLNCNNLHLSRPVSEWDKTNSLKYNNKPLGIFQIHTTRNCIKFRFNFNNLLDLININRI